MKTSVKLFYIIVVALGLTACSDSDDSCGANATLETTYEQLYKIDEEQSSETKKAFVQHDGSGRMVDAAFAYVTLDDGRSADMSHTVKSVKPFSTTQLFMLERGSVTMFEKHGIFDAPVIRKIRSTRDAVRSQLQTNMLKVQELSMTDKEIETLRKAVKGQSNSNMQVCTVNPKMYMLATDYDKGERSLVFSLKARIKLPKP